MRQMAIFFSISKNTSVLDIGGSCRNWSYLDNMPKLTILNIMPRPENLPRQVEYVCGDARKLPFGDKTFDVVYSNSVIEHVGSKYDHSKMAMEMMRVGRGYYCQTPNYWFPIEPHFLGFVIHWFPKSIRARLIQWFSFWGWLTKSSSEKAHEMADSITLLKQNEMDAIFPNSHRINEKVLGFVKSLVSARSGDEKYEREYPRDTR
jgi:ubiquinone/menaquinone biosynthesis C-methylase UbiE